MIVKATRPDTTEQDFARYEFKYLLSNNLARTIEQEVGHLMTYDGHVHEEMGNRYLVRSLYFDTPGSDNYYEKIDGIKDRKKFRIRTYEREPGSGAPVFLEQKGRQNERTYKRRVEIAEEDIPLFTQNEAFAPLSRYADVPLVKEFIFEKARNFIAPRVLVDYQRRPYMSYFDMNFRLTFDSALCAVACDTLFPGPQSGWLQCKAGYTILEVKFHRRIPAWFHRILQAQNMRRLSISKFCSGMETCGVAVDLS